MKIRFSIILIILVTVIARMGPAAVDDDKKGIVTHSEGQVKRKALEEQNWHNAPVNTAVISGDMVRTYRQARAELNIADQMDIRLASRTLVYVDKLLEETEEKVMKTSIKLEQGDLWASVEEIETNTEFDISAPIAAAAITGTVLRMKVDTDSTTQLKVYDGEVKIKNLPDVIQRSSQSLVPHEVPGPHEVQGPKEVSVEEWIQIVKAMQQITINKQGKVVSYGDFKDDDPDEKTDWVNWNKQRDQIRFK